MTADEVRELAAGLLAFVDRIAAQTQSEVLIREALAPLVRELGEVRGLPTTTPAVRPRSSRSAGSWRLANRRRPSD